MARIERDSETWRAVRDWAEGRLAMRRVNLEVTGLPIDETENQRGAIEELKELLAQGQPDSSEDGE